MTDYFSNMRLIFKRDLNYITKDASSKCEVISETDLLLRVLANFYGHAEVAHLSVSGGSIVLNKIYTID